MPQFDKRSNQSFLPAGVGRSYEAVSVVGQVLATGSLDMQDAITATFVLLVNMTESNVGNTLSITDAVFEMDNDPGFSNPELLSDANFIGDPNDFILDQTTNSIVTHRKVGIKGTKRYVRLTVTVDNDAVVTMPLPISTFSINVAVQTAIPTA